ncbi:hypothetical protein BV898_02838 [Hypsibius exemplaris]|uniref:Receptor ligand binding region domain-containing protein n=1 Tax=Hypsibius exemplaris TaxID=2072580 RepID=A0A1W0X7V5_HYPEX|nr:hypothetical protein BV898_02838 [Hypsibius exemplaris]
MVFLLFFIYSGTLGLCLAGNGHTVSLPRIALASTTIIVPEANTTNDDAIQTSGPAIDLGVEHLQQMYGRIFNFTHTYLMDPDRPTIPFLLDDVLNFAAQFVYENADADGMAFLSSYKSVLLGCSGGSVPVSPTESNGHCFGLSVYPGSVIMKFIYALLTANQWTNIAGLVDMSSIAGEYLSRGKIAEELGMTNGEYVFFMLTFSRFGSSLDRLDDAWWKVTDPTDDSPIPLRGYVSRATIVISFRSPYTGLDAPIRELRSRIVAAARRNYNMTYPRDQVPTFLYAAYEMHQVYGMILNKTYSQTRRILSGLEMGTLIRNETFRLPTGEISFSPSGERDVDMIGEILDPQTMDYMPSLLYDPNSEDLINTTDIGRIWPGGHWPPPNVPKCGYLGNGCAKSSQSKGNMVLSVAVGLAVCVVVLGVTAIILIRHYRSRMDADTWWIIRVELMAYPRPRFLSQMK